MDVLELRISQGSAAIALWVIRSVTADGVSDYGSDRVIRRSQRKNRADGAYQDSGDGHCRQHRAWNRSALFNRAAARSTGMIDAQPPD